jgi:hypothetical protein
MWHSYRVRWGTEEYRAVPEPRPDGLFMRLLRSGAADGFEQVNPNLYVRVVPAADCETILFVTTVCQWRGAPFQVHDERGDELLLEYTGGEVPTAQRLGLQRIERGVYRRWVQRADVRELQESQTELSQ